MGYHTEFVGKFDLDRSLAPEHQAFLVAFSRTRLVKWDAREVQQMPDSIREKCGLPVGIEGAYFLGYEYNGQDDEPPFLIDDNEPPHNQPGLWCGWAPNEDGTQIVWNEQEK